MCYDIFFAGREHMFSYICYNLFYAEGEHITYCLQGEFLCTQIVIIKRWRMLEFDSHDTFMKPLQRSTCSRLPKDYGYRCVL